MAFEEVTENGEHIGFVEYVRGGGLFGDGWTASDGWPHKAIMRFATKEEAAAYLIQRKEQRQQSVETPN